VSYFRFSAFGRDIAFAGGRGALNPAKLADVDNVFVNAAANEGLAPNTACLAMFAGLDGD